MRRSLVLLSFVSLLLLPAATLAQTAKRPMTFEDMMHMKRLGDTAASKDGQWLGYSVTTVSLAQNTTTTELWLQKIAGGEPIRVAVAKPGDSGVQFAPDGRAVLFLSGREEGQQVWLADFDPATGATSNARRLTTIATGADNAIWSPDGRFVLFSSAVYPDCPAITTADFKTGNQCNAQRDAAAAASKVKARIFTHLMYRHWNHYTGDKRGHLFLVSVATGEMRDLNPGDPHDVPPFSLEGGGCGCAFAPDSKELAFTEKDVAVEATSTNADIFTLDLTDPAAKPVKVSMSPGGDFSPAYSPDGKWLAWRSQSRAGYESDKFRLVVMERSSQSASPQVSTPAIHDLLPKFDNWVDEFAWAPDSREIYFVSAVQGEDPVMVTNLDGQISILSNDGSFGGLEPLSNGTAVVSTRTSVASPGEVVEITPASRESAPKGQASTPSTPAPGGLRPVTVTQIRQITNLNSKLLYTQLDVPKMQSFWFTAQDGTRLEGFLIPPPGFDPQKKYPVKFLIHGGPQGNWGDSWSYRWNAELFAANGYVVVMINPRGSTGYGQAVVDGVNGDWGGKPFTDLMTGLDYAEQHYPFIDKTRECALGASYGGYMADWILGHTDRFRCIVTHDGMFDPESAYGSTEELWFNEWEFKGMPWDYYGKPDSENPYRNWSPMLAAKNFKTPTLVIHGQLDYRLDVSQGFALFTTLQRLGVPSKMLYFPDEGHFVLKPQNAQLWYRTVNGWVDEWTKEGGGTQQ